MHAAFYLLLGASLARFLLRHPGETRTPWIIGLSIALAALYALLYVRPAHPAPDIDPPPTGGGARTGAGARTDSARTDAASTDAARTGAGDAPTQPPHAHAALAAVVAVWVVLVVLAPSFAWCAVPLLYTGLRTLPSRTALALVTLLTAFVVTAQLQLAEGGFDPNLVLAPPAVAAIATGVFVYMQRQTARQRTLIDDLIRTRRELAATERREGTLAERQRLSMEIHDTLAQGLSSQQMLLQAADRTWDTDPATARRHVLTATSIAEHNLAEARRFVHDLAPADLAEAGARGGGLEEALRTVATRENARFHLDGTATPLPDRVQSALLRIAQGALANVREHAGATTTAVTLTYLDDQVVLDIADDGRGFDLATLPGPTDVRGHGLPAIRARVQQLGGTLAVESAPGEGTVLSAAIPFALPLEPTP
ncbi:sensor histidine kinase [Streptomyces sp. NPDC051561]|uniref:sensor histidine kinase n=1 Tax=Streptomyces sp. NPDC051561 TaxID=3365658 RepID=UPI0037979BD4